MALVNATSLVGLLVLLYLSSFVFLAVLRVATGISIQRIGYFSLRHIYYTPRDGIRIDIRGLGLAIHRPTFAQPTWVSLRLQELCITLDPKVLGAYNTARSKTFDESQRSIEDKDVGQNVGTPHKGHRRSRSQMWKKLTDVKERLKKIHSRINWLRMLDLDATQTSLVVVGAGTISLAGFTMAVHTRRKLLDRGRLFRHKKDPAGGQRPAEWIFTLRNVLLTVDGREPVEMLDQLSANVHGLLYADKEGLRDTSVAIKAGRLYVPMDDLLLLKSKSRHLSTRPKERPVATPYDEITFDEIAEELDRPGSREAAIVQTVADSKEFFSSILRSVQEIQLGMSFIRVSKDIDLIHRPKQPLTLNMVTHEIGVDLHRIDQNAPAHRMYFNRSDIAHQALLAMVSVSVSLDEDELRTNRIMYIPMATMTVRTTLPSKTMSFTQERDAAERNTNVLFVNLVVTSPAVDLVPQHLIQLLAIAQRNKKSSPPSEQQHSRHRIISRLLPRASIKTSIQEPVVRFVLPVADPAYNDPDDFDMIISAISSISLDAESSHTQGGELQYSLASNFRLVNHRLYYQSASGAKHNLLTTDGLELKAQVSASSEVLVVASGILRSFSILMVREEVSRGVYNIVRHFKRNVPPEKLDETSKTRTPAFLRKLPAWLLEFHFEATDFTAELAGMDVSISNQTRGLALQLESWTADYKAQKTQSPKRPPSRRKRTPSSNLDEQPSVVSHLPAPSAIGAHHANNNSTDGRRLAVHVKSFEGFVIEALDEWEPKPFVSVPRLEVALSTARDLEGSIFHVNSAVKAIYLEFSLYRLYSVGVASSVLRDAFQGPPIRGQDAASPNTSQGQASSSLLTSPTPQVPPSTELVTVDVRVQYVQVKAFLPADPPLMLQLFDVSTGKHRWSTPFVRMHLARLHVQSPYVMKAWARLISLNTVRIELRQMKKKVGSEVINEKSVELMTDFIRFGVPHGLVMYRVFDNIVNTVKSTEQLMHRFKTRTNEYILFKNPEGPKHVPRISVRTKALMFELEDDAFEWKLSNIYRVGRQEQQQRLARAAAYDLKVRKMRDERTSRATSRLRAQSSRPVSRTASPESRRSHSADSHTTAHGRRSMSRGRGGQAPKLRYDRDGACAVSGSAKVQAAEAWERLQEHNARSWKSRIDRIASSQNATVRTIRRMFSGADEPPPDDDCHELVLGIPARPGILTIVISDLHLLIDRPSFSLDKLPDFLHEVGKGMPKDMEYGLLIPLNLTLNMGEARFMLRDYPLNLLHVPAIKPGQPSRLPSWSLKTDFIIAEEFRDTDSQRHVKVEIVPKGKEDEDGKGVPGFYIDVRRTIAPTKTYSKPVIDINTSQPTSISWGTAYQPVIQDMMQIIEAFTKPEIDPSDRVGFWDKIRLSFHSRPIINWKGDGDVHLCLKGSRDPYVVTGHGAGFVMCWRNNVRWAVHESDDPKEFMTVKSGEFVLAIPDYSHQARSGASFTERPLHDDESSSSGSSLKNAAIFKKVIMKVSGNVQWTAGLVVERDLGNGKGSLTFKPHWDVVLKNPDCISEEQMKTYDAYEGFRSHFIHLSVSIAAPVDREWGTTKSASPDSYNSVHLSPRFFAHFFDWWSLFSGIMSLPVRQGPLWRSPEKSSKKFGRHLASIKYGLLLSPLYLAHVYKHKDSEDYAEDVVSATGLKLRLNSFIMDVHQRREFFDTLSKGRGEQQRTSSMKIHRAELDFVQADLRAVAASIAGTTIDDLKRATDETMASYQEPPSDPDMSKFHIPDHDLSWIDMDDFVELDWLLPAESTPKTQILPLAFTPRFTYFRETDHGEGIQGDQHRTSPFGDEDTHFCIMENSHNDPREVQMRLIKARLEAIEKQLEENGRLLKKNETASVKNDHKKAPPGDSHDVRTQQEELENKKSFLQQGLQRLQMRMSPGDFKSSESDTREQNGDGDVSGDALLNNTSSHVDMDGLYNAPHDEFASDFNNRFIVHNAQVKWNNALRNTILRYIHQVSQRRGFVYYMSRRAVKFIIDIVDEQSKRDAERKDSFKGATTPPGHTDHTSPTEEKDDENIVQDRIQQILSDGKRFVDAPEETQVEGSQGEQDADSIQDQKERKIAGDFQPMNSYHVRLIAPQIQLQSEKNTKSVALLTAKGMQLKVVAIMDKARMNDEISGLVQRRFALDMDGVQIFVTTQKRLSRYLHLYSGNRYGNAPGSSWPPWASIEAMFDFHLDPFGFQRVIQKTSASLRYEKYNPLRLKYNEEVSDSADREHRAVDRTESRIDHLWVDFPRLRASCDSEQYFTMYIIVLDLLMYSEPLEKTREERLEKIMLATDFSDLRGAPEMAEKLQERIRQLEEIKNHFQVHAKYLDRQGWRDRIDLEKDLAHCEEELFFIMKAINMSQQRSTDNKQSDSAGFLRWYLSSTEIVWHLMRSKDEPLLEFQLGNAAYERIDNSDGSNHNALEIEQIRGWNLLPNALYPEIVGPFHDPTQKQIPEHERKMFRVHWYMLEAIAGIPIVEEFQVDMFPLKVQLERELGSKIMEYVFPNKDKNANGIEGDSSPFMIKNRQELDDSDHESEEAQAKLSPDVTLTAPSESELSSSSPGTMGRRLQPTYNLNFRDKPTASSNTPKKQGPQWLHQNPFTKHQPAQHRQQMSQALAKKASQGSLNGGMRERIGSTTSLRDAEQMSRSSSRDNRFGGVIRVNSDRSSLTKRDKEKKEADDLSQMMSRASNYMTIAHIKLNSVVLCLSYKGKSDRNIEDLHDFVFRLPSLEYRNKTWSNLDLVNALKRDVIKALISHTGAILGNKFSHSRPGKKQAEKLREIALGNTMIPNKETLSNFGTEETSSLYSLTPVSNSDGAPSRMSLQSDRSGGATAAAKNTLAPSPLLRAHSWRSIHSVDQPAALSSSTPASQDADGLILRIPNSGVTNGQSPMRRRSSHHSLDPFSPLSPPRPNTAQSGGLPGRSLLKDKLRQFSAVGGETIKSRVRFRSDADKSPGRDEVSRIVSIGRDPEDNLERDSDMDNDSGSVVSGNRLKRKSTLKKVLGRLTDN